jgi:hypothetical protein
VTYNGQQVAVEFIDNRAVFALPVVLQNGTNEFVFTIQPKSTDTDCNPVNETLTLTYPPIVTQCLETEQVTLTFENLPTNNLFNTVAYQFTGVVNGTGNLSGLTINNTPVVVADDGTFVVS